MSRIIAIAVDVANALTETQLKQQPFFRRFGEDIDVYADNDTDAQVFKNYLLARAIPALSDAAGRTAISDDEFPFVNFDMNISMKDGWPQERGPKEKDKNWRHSDAKDIAYRYVYKLYDEWVTKGQLKK